MIMCELFTLFIGWEAGRQRRGLHSSERKPAKNVCLSNRTTNDTGYMLYCWQLICDKVNVGRAINNGERYLNDK